MPVAPWKALFCKCLSDQSTFEKHFDFKYQSKSIQQLCFNFCFVSFHIFKSVIDLDSTVQELLNSMHEWGKKTGFFALIVMKMCFNNFKLNFWFNFFL